MLDISNSQVKRELLDTHRTFTNGKWRRCANKEYDTTRSSLDLLRYTEFLGLQCKVHKELQEKDCS
jgi:hypothetical protein